MVFSAMHKTILQSMEMRCGSVTYLLSERTYCACWERNEVKIEKMLADYRVADWSISQGAKSKEPRRTRTSYNLLLARTSNLETISNTTALCVASSSLLHLSCHWFLAWLHLWSFDIHATSNSWLIQLSRKKQLATSILSITRNVINSCCGPNCFASRMCVILQTASP